MIWLNSLFLFFLIQITCHCWAVLSLVGVHSDLFIVMGSGFLSFPSLDSCHVNPTQPNCGVTSPTTHYLLPAFVGHFLWESDAGWAMVNSRDEEGEKYSKNHQLLHKFVKNTPYLTWTKTFIFRPPSMLGKAPHPTSTIPIRAGIWAFH